MGAQSFRGYARGYGVQITEEKAEELLDGWHSAWPEMADYFGWINELEWRDGQRKDRAVRVTDVTQLYSKRHRANITYTTACNSLFQGLAADAAKQAAFALVEACELGELQGWKVWNFIHDEFILEGPEEDCDRAAKVVQRIMVEQAQKWVPDVPIHASPAAMYRWSKKAKPVYENGKLVPWKAAA
jgi:DNA polymerase I-like protein with 3'-5' exonuclease and polymerase domains